MKFLLLITLVVPFGCQSTRGELPTRLVRALDGLDRLLNLTGDSIEDILQDHSDQADALLRILAGHRKETTRLCAALVEIESPYAYVASEWLRGNEANVWGRISKRKLASIYTYRIAKSKVDNWMVLGLGEFKHFFRISQAGRRLVNCGLPAIKHLYSLTTNEKKVGRPDGDRMYLIRGIRFSDVAAAFILMILGREPTSLSPDPNVRDVQIENLREEVRRLKGVWSGEEFPAPQDNDQVKSGIRAKRLFKKLDKKLAGAKTLQFEYRAILEKQGKIILEFDGSFLLQEGNKTYMDADGILIISNGRKISYGGKEIADSPKNLSNEIAATIPRLGIYWSIYFGPCGPAPRKRLEQPGSWRMSTLSGFKMGRIEKIGGRKAQVIEFKVDDAKVTLWCDVETGLPVAKRVYLGEGAFITETYFDLRINEEIDSEKFVLPEDD